jgi:hypothetical protein
MASRLAGAGFHLDGASVFPILNLRCDDDSYSKGLAEGIQNFVRSRNDVSAENLDEWYGEFERLSETGTYFFSTNRYIFRASRPAAQTR